MDSLKLLSPPLPGHPYPNPAESRPWAAELGTHSFPTSNFISWRSIWCAPSPTENLVVPKARVQQDSSVSLFVQSSLCLLLWIGRKGHQGPSGPGRFTPGARAKAAQDSGDGWLGLGAPRAHAHTRMRTHTPAGRQGGPELPGECACRR